MKSINFKDINIKGELAVRSGLNFARLEGQWYRPDEVFKADSHGWPADWEGRIILGLTMLSQATHRTAAYLDEIISLIPEHLNAKGYFGTILPKGKFDEQHFGGHSWIIRGLVEYFYFKKDQKVKEIIEKLVINFLLPVKGSFSKYPIEPVKRFENQDTWILSKLQTKTKHHAETSDAGCAFIMLDGVTAAYELLVWPELKELSEEIIERFMEMDFQALHIQTHATLSGIRGIIRFYEITKESKYLDMAQQKVNYDIYGTGNVKYRENGSESTGSVLYIAGSIVFQVVKIADGKQEYSHWGTNLKQCFIICTINSIWIESQRIKNSKVRDIANE